MTLAGEQGTSRRVHGNSLIFIASLNERGMQAPPTGSHAHPNGVTWCSHTANAYVHGEVDETTHRGANVEEKRSHLHQSAARSP